MTSAASLSRINLAPLLSLREGADPARWEQLRGAQLRAVRRSSPFLLLVNLLAAGLAATIFAGSVAVTLLVGWAAVLTASSVGVALRRWRWDARDHVGASMAQVRATAIDGLALALPWALAPTLFGSGQGAAALGLQMVLSTATVAVAVALAPLLIAALLFVVAVAGTVALSLVLAGAYAAAAAIAALAVVLAIVCVGRARALVRERDAALLLEDRDQTVGLLLGDSGDGAAGWLWEIDAGRRIARASPRFAAACGAELAAIEGLPLLQVLAGPTWEAGNFAPGLRHLAEKLKTRSPFRDLALPVTIAGVERWWELSAVPRLHPDGHFLGFRGVGIDVTERRASDDRISRMARYDALTGLPNRLHVNEALARALSEAERWRSRCAFMMIDLDRFKAVNDTLGHPVGDRLLGRVAERLARIVTDNEIVGRLGGDEFAVVVRDAGDPDAVERLARRIIDTLSRPYEVDQHTLFIGASVGVATSPRDGKSADTLVRSADLALYRSKDRGGGVFHAYEPQLHSDAEERRVLELALRAALEGGELHLAYQPVVDASDGLLRGFEALLRWDHPTHGQVPPAKFVPIAEETRLIGPIGEWVVRTACAEAARWPDHLRVAVNVSAEQLHNPQFVTVIANALAQSGLLPERLELEVTESVFMREGTAAPRVLDQILDLGVRLSLDDFGTGYSSLGYLSRTRFSSIKIDRSFVARAAAGAAEAVAIIRAVVALAQSLGMATTAEGVETAEEQRLVRDLGCTRLQGFFFGRPLGVTETRQLIDRCGDAARTAA